MHCFFDKLGIHCFKKKSINEPKGMFGRWVRRGGMVYFVYRQNLTNMLHNSVIMQSLLRMRKQKSSSGSIHISAKLHGVFAKSHVD